MTPFETQCEILSDMWLNYRTDEAVSEMFEYFDLGFPLAYAYNESLIKLEPSAKVLIEDTFSAVVVAFGHEDDTGFETLSDLGDI